MQNTRSDHYKRSAKIQSIKSKVGGMWYTTKELADLLGVSERTIQRRAKKGEWQTRMEPGHGGNGEVYKILYDPKVSDTINDRSATRSTTDQRHPKEDEISTTLNDTSTTPADTLDNPLSTPREPQGDNKEHPLFRTSIDCTPYAEMPDEYLREAYLKGQLVKEYLYNTNIKTKSERMKKVLSLFNAGLHLQELHKMTGSISSRTFRRWIKTLKDAGEDYRALTPHYHHHYRGRSIPEDVQQRLLKILLSPNCTAVGTAILHVQDQYRLMNQEIPVSERTMRRWIKDWSSQHMHIWTQTREGLKAYDEQVNKTILRDINLLNVGDVWVADGHVLSFDIIDPYDQKPKRMTLIVWFDMRSRMPVGCAVNSTEDSQCIALALRNAILFTGHRPKFVYIDNGKAFKSKIFTSKPSDHDLEHELGGYFYRMGIQPHYAIPYNAKAKTVERFFLTVQDQYERLISTFRGRDISDKPATLMRNEKWMQKLYERKPLTMEEFKITFEFWVMELYAKHDHKGLEGDNPLNVFKSAEVDKHLIVEPSELNHLMLCSKKRKISNNGIKHNRLWYWAEELVPIVKQEVTIRYDNFNINSILVYDETDNFICQAHRRQLQHPFVHLSDDPQTKRDLERAIKEKNRIRKKHKKATEEYLKDLEGSQIIPDKAIGELFNDKPLISEPEPEPEPSKELEGLFDSPQRTQRTQREDEDNDNKTTDELHELFINTGLKGE